MLLIVFITAFCVNFFKTRALIFGLQIHASEELPRGIVKVFLCSFYFWSDFLLKSRMRSKPS